MSFPDAFATARLSAERLEPEHYADVLRMHLDPVQMEMLGGVRDEAQTRAYLDKNLAHWEAHNFGIWILRNREGAVIGRALLRHFPIEGAEEIEVGYSLAPAHWGQGLATEITTALLEYGRTALDLATIVALTLPENVRSQRVMIKAGMTFDREVVHDGLRHVLFRWRAG